MIYIYIYISVTFLIILFTINVEAFSNDEPLENFDINTTTGLVKYHPYNLTWLDFNGQNSTIKINQTTNLNITKNLTITAWVKKAKLSSAGFLVTRALGTNPDWFFSIDDGQNRLYFGNGGGWRETSSKWMRRDEWYFIALAVANTSVSIYSDRAPEEIYTIGDSITKGNGGSNVHLCGQNNTINHSYQYWLDQHLNTFISNEDYSTTCFYNKGLGGNRCDQIDARFNSDIGNNTKVILMCGINDIAAGATNDTIFGRIDSIYNKSMAKNNTLILLEIIPDGEINNAYCDNITSVNQWMPGYVAARQNISLVYLYDHFTNGSTCGINTSLYESDLVHPNYDGLKKIAYQIWNQSFNFTNYSTTTLYEQALRTNTVWSGLSSSTSGIIWIGSRNGALSFFNGSVDDIRIYNNTLNSSQITQIYDQGRVGDLTLLNSSLVLFFRLQKNNGVVAYDSSSVGNNGELNNTVWNTDGINITTLNRTITINITSLSNSLIFWDNYTLIGNALNGSQIISFYDNQSVYVLDEFNITEGETRTNSPLWFYDINTTQKKIASNLTSSINTSIIFYLNSTLGCGNLQNITVNGTTTDYFSTYNVTQITCQNSNVSMTTQVENSSQSTIIFIIYNSTVTESTIISSNSGGGGSPNFYPSEEHIEQVYPSEEHIEQVYPSEEHIEQGYTKIFPRNSIIKFAVGNAAHNLIIKNIADNSIVIVVQSIPQQATIAIGEEKRFELTNDTYYDLSVRLNSIQNNFANITIKSIHKLIEVMPAINTQKNETELPVDEEDTNIYIYFSIADVLLVGLAIYLVYYRHKR